MVEPRTPQAFLISPAYRPAAFALAGTLYEVPQHSAWGNVRSVMRDGHVFLSLIADVGTYEFEPVAKKP
mgnify:CR=1 FL=1